MACYDSGYARWAATPSSIARGRRCQSSPPLLSLFSPSASCNDRGRPHNCCCFRRCRGCSCPPRCRFCCCGCHFPSKPKLPPPSSSLARPPPTPPPKPEWRTPLALGPHIHGNGAHLRCHPHAAPVVVVVAFVFNFLVVFAIIVPPSAGNSSCRGRSRRSPRPPSAEATRT